MSTSRIEIVNVIRFCHHLTVLEKCHHERDDDIKQERAEKVGGIKPGGDGQDEWQGSSGSI